MLNFRLSTRAYAPGRAIRGLTALTAALFVLACGQGPESTGREPSALPAKEENRGGTAGLQGEGVWYLDWDEGIEAAKKAAKPVVVNFHADWCGYCRAMDENTLRAPQITKMLASDWVAIRVDVEDRKTEGTFEGKRLPYSDLAQFLGVRGLPSFLFIDAQGGPIQVVSGYFSAQNFEFLLDYVRTGLYKGDMSLEEYIASRS